MCLDVVSRENRGAAQPLAAPRKNHPSEGTSILVALAIWVDCGTYSDALVPAPTVTIAWVVRFRSADDRTRIAAPSRPARTKGHELDATRGVLIVIRCRPRRLEV